MRAGNDVHDTRIDTRNPSSPWSLATKARRGSGRRAREPYASPVHRTGAMSLPVPRDVRGQRASPPPLTHDIDNGSRVVIDRCGDRYGRWAAFGEYIHPSLDQTTDTNATTGLRGPSSVYRPQEVSSDDACARSYAQTLTDRAGTLLASHGMCARYCEQGHVARDAQLMVHRLLANITRCFFWLGCVLCTSTRAHSNLRLQRALRTCAPAAVRLHDPGAGASSLPPP